MYMTVSFMVIDAQDARAVRKYASPALGGSFHYFYHRNSYNRQTINEKDVKINAFPILPIFKIFCILLIIPELSGFVKQIAQIFHRLLLSITAPRPSSKTVAGSGIGARVII